jgi:hypothetical protein
MNGLTLFGLVAVTAMLVFYAVEARSPYFILAFAAACVMASVYGFLQGAWPFGIVEGVWSAVALRRWWMRRRADAGDPAQLVDIAAPNRSGNGFAGDTW